jgi:hypothetical protein
MASDHGGHSTIESAICLRVRTRSRLRNSDTARIAPYACAMRRSRARLGYAVWSACAVSLLAAHLSAAPNAKTQPASGAAGAATPVPTTLPVASVQSIFFIAKNENKNQVHYALVVDAACRPVGTHPVYGYWRDFEKGPKAVSPMLEHEQPAYGLGEPRYVRATPTGGQVRINLRGFPERPLIIDSFRQGSNCVTRTTTTILKQAALLTSIYVDIGFLFSVNYAILRGVRVADGAVVQEKIHD